MILRLILPSAALAFTCQLIAEEGAGGATRNVSRATTATTSQMLFADGEETVIYRLAETEFPDRPSPEKELLNATANQQAIASLLKDERNRKIKPGLEPPDDKDALGIKIRFDAIRFLKDSEDTDRVRVRLVGPINEVECKKPLPIKELIESKEPIPIRFESITNHTGVTVTITTDIKLKWQAEQVVVTGTKGTFDFAVALFSPARLLYSSDSDSVSLPDLSGKRVAEKELVPRSLLEPEKL